MRDIYTSQPPFPQHLLTGAQGSAAVGRVIPLAALNGRLWFGAETSPDGVAPGMERPSLRRTVMRRRSRQREKM